MELTNVFIVCITVIFCVLIISCCYKKIVNSKLERYKLEAKHELEVMQEEWKNKIELERLYFEKNKDEEINALKERIKELERKECDLKKDKEFEVLKFQKEFFEKNIKSENNINKE